MSRRSKSQQTSVIRPRILVCDDNEVRLQAVAHELSLFPTGSTIEIVSPRNKYATGVFSINQEELPHFPILIFLINVGSGNILPSTIYGVVEGQGRVPDPSTYQLFQVCHVSKDYLIKNDSLNALRYIFTVSSTVLEIALCILDTISKYVDIPQTQFSSSYFNGIHSVTSEQTPPISASTPVMDRYQTPCGLRRQSGHGRATHQSPHALSHYRLSFGMSSSRPKICVSRRVMGALPRIRYVNSDFENCFGHASSWICGRCINVLGGLQTQSNDFLLLCSLIDCAFLSAESIKTFSNCSIFQQERRTHARDITLTLYSAGGVAMKMRVAVTTLQNWSGDHTTDSVAILALDCLS